MELRELIVLVRRALDVLEPANRVLLLEKFGQELTHQEISQRYNIPLGTVCTRVARGLRQVQAQLKNAPSLLKELREYLR
jgi:RNA polymerase sigma-70 factor, ECF subfamily